MLTEKDMNAAGLISGRVEIKSDEMLENDHDSFAELLSERLTGSPLLTGVCYRIAGVTDHAVIFLVSGNARMIWPPTELEEPETAPLLNLPPHKCDLTITHNEHRSFYQTVEQRLKEIAGFGMDVNWETSEMRARAIEADEMWEMRWYPDTPMSYIAVSAPTLPDLLRFALQQSKDQ